MHMDPMMPYLVGSVAAILLLGIILRALHQPYIVGYLLAGVVLGPAGLGLVTDQVTIARLGEVGVILLLFFVGMEVSLPQLIRRWQVPVVGTLLQIALSLACTIGLGMVQGWPWPRSILLGFVISLSSTAVVVKVLQGKGEMNDPIGRDVVGILVMQDLAIVPMLIVVGFMGGASLSSVAVALQVLCGILVVVLLAYVARREDLRLPLRSVFRDDPELQVFAGGLFCFGFALITGLAGLSAALGAFLGGIILGAAKESHWIHRSLFPLHVLLLALFFVSVGMLIDFAFLAEHVGMIVSLLVAVLVTNTVVNMVTLRVLGRTWRNSLYGGAVLAQVGEFSFVLAAVGKQAGLIEEYGYQMTIVVIALSMLCSPGWISLASRYRTPPLASASRYRTPPP